MGFHCHHLEKISQIIIPDGMAFPDPTVQCYRKLPESQHYLSKKDTGKIEKRSILVSTSPGCSYPESVTQEFNSNGRNCYKRLLLTLCFLPNLGEKRLFKLFFQRVCMGRMQSRHNFSLLQSLEICSDAALVVSYHLRHNFFLIQLIPGVFLPFPLQDYFRFPHYCIEKHSVLGKNPPVSCEQITSFQCYWASPTAMHNGITQTSGICALEAFCRCNQNFSVLICRNVKIALHL